MSGAVFCTRKSGGVQKLSGAVFCTRKSEECKKLSGAVFCTSKSGGVQKIERSGFLHKRNCGKTGNIVSNQWRIGMIPGSENFVKEI